jgi:nitrogen fixation NifU-like protein
MRLYRNPLNYGELSDADARIKDSNPLCGDVIEIQLKLDTKGRVGDIKFRGEGCAISQASASLLTESVKGKTIEDIDRLTLQDVLNLLQVPIGKARIDCALLPLKVLKQAISVLQNPKEGDPERT